MSSKSPIVFIHGLWMHPDSWQPWQTFFESNGYATYAATWPGDKPTVSATRENAQGLGGHGITEIADFIEAFINTLDSKPILIGHSFGGLLAQILLDRSVASAAIAIDAAPIRGVWQIPATVLRSSFPVLSNPLNYWHAKALSFSQFKYSFANELTNDEARTLFDAYTIPGPGRPLFQAATATLNPWAQNHVNVKNATRGPLLLIGGEKDHIAPKILTNGTYKKYLKSGAKTDTKIFANRGHSLVLDSGWQEIAHYSLDWLTENQ